MSSVLRSLFVGSLVLATAGPVLAQFPPLPGGPPGANAKPPANPLAPPGSTATTGAGPSLPGPFGQLLAALGPEKAATVGKDLGEAIRGVSLYPERTRTAILTVAKYSTSDPKLLGDLASLPGKPAAEIDKFLTSRGYADELQYSAAIVLVDAPDTFARMQERAELTAAAGQAYANPAAKGLIDAVLAAAHEQQTQVHSGSVDAWAERLKSDPELLQQYLQMLAAYAQQAQSQQTTTDSSATDSGSTTGTTGSTTGGVTASVGYDPYGYGTTASDSGYTVSDVPSEDVVNYALANGYQYAEVADAMIDQYMTEENLEDYSQAVGDWYSKYGDSIPAETYAAHQDYYDSLKELSNFDDAVSKTAGGRVTPEARREFLEKNPSQFQKLAGRVERAPRGTPGSKGPFSGLTPGGTKGPGPAGNPLTGGPKNPLGPTGSKPPAGGPPGAGANPFSSLLKGTPPTSRPPATPKLSGNPFQMPKGGKPPMGAGGGNPFQLGGGKQPPMNVTRGQPSFGNQLGRAQSFHGAAWGGGGPKMGGAGGPRPGGGMGGPRPGGGGPGGGRPGGPGPGR